MLLADRSHKKGAWIGTIRAITQCHPDPKNKGPGCHSWAKLFPSQGRRDSNSRPPASQDYSEAMPSTVSGVSWTNPVKIQSKSGGVASSGKQIELSAPYRLRPDVRLSVDILYTVRSRRYVPFRT